MNLEQYQSIITKYNVDTHGNPIAVIKTDNQKVHPTKYMIQTGILEESYRFTILNKEMQEVFDIDDIATIKDFFVDYDNGKLYFHKDMAGVTIQYRCADLGCDMINACRIVSDFDDNGNVRETLDSLIANINNAVITKGIIKENYIANIPKESLVYNSNTGLFEYNLNHKLNSNKITIGIYDGAEPLINLCRKLDANNLIVANDDKIDLIVVINYGSVN